SQCISVIVYIHRKVFFPYRWIHLIQCIYCITANGMKVIIQLKDRLSDGGISRSEKRDAVSVQSTFHIRQLNYFIQGIKYILTLLDVIHYRTLVHFIMGP